MNDIKSAFDRGGFAVLPGFLDAAEFAALSSYFDAYIRDVVPTLNGAAFYHDGGLLKSFVVDPPANPKWTALAELLIGESALLYGLWMDKVPGFDSPTPPHQDNVYLHKPNVATIWLALDPVDDDNGCLRYIPGSHRHGFRPHGRPTAPGVEAAMTDFGPADETAGVPIHLQPGDAVAHHGSTIHWTRANTSTRHRRALAMVFGAKS